ncbi:Pyrroline-5-carboxylate reductase [Rickettsiales bacterium Ac37b]|nr:Pyrroline-5-carboxylate reductase [Rickettsiales bacterium Ac37b]
MVNKHIILVGCGNMGLALLKGWLAGGISPSLITVISPNNWHSLQKMFDINALPEIKDSAINQNLDYTIVFAIKPQIAEQIIPLYKFLTQNKNNLFISIITGKTLSFFTTHLTKECKVVRAMPNLAAIVSASTTVLHGNNNLSDLHKHNSSYLFNMIGKTWWIDNEYQLDTITALSGSGIAYFFSMVNYLAEAACSIGLDAKLSNELAINTINSSAQLLVQGTNSPSTLINQVCSPGGTTEAALETLNPGLKELIYKTLYAATNRSRQLSE